MGSQTLSLNTGSGTTATFRAWGSAISAALTAVGLVQTADTGQINWTTIASPVGSATSAGYEIWRFNDTLQATKPIFIKIEYGTGSTVSTPQMWVTVGTATDGAGTLSSAPGTGTSISSRLTLGSTSNSVSGSPTGNCYVTTPDSSVVAALLWAGVHASWGGMFFLVERTRDADGTPNGDGYILIASKSGASNDSQVTFEQRHFSSLLAPVQKGSVLAPGQADAALSSATDGTTLYPVPVFTGFTWRLGGPSKAVVSIGKGDVPANNTFSMSMYSAARTFVSAGGGTTASSGWGAWITGGTSTSGLNSFALRLD